MIYVQWKIMKANYSIKSTIGGLRFWFPMEKDEIRRTHLFPYSIMFKVLNSTFDLSIMGVFLYHLILIWG